MIELNDLEKSILSQISDLHSVPEGAFNIRENGKGIARNSTEEIQIIPKKNKSGIDIIVAAGVKNRSVHIPVILSVGGFTDLVYNDFYIGEGSDVLIVAGCGIHNSTCNESRHDGIHTFHIGRGATVRYVEKHLGTGGGEGGKVLNPVTKIKQDKFSKFIMETYQLGGVTDSVRKTTAKLLDGAELEIREKILTTDNQKAHTVFKVDLDGENSRCEVISRAVAKNNSYQNFESYLVGNNACFGHVECDAIILDKATVSSTPKIFAKNVDASLVHEAAIGKIAGDQLIKLMTLGLTQKQAEDMIIKGYLT